MHISHEKWTKQLSPSRTHKNQSGSALYFILIAVALFAALSFMVSESLRSGGTQISEEKTRVLVSAILDYGRTMRQTVQTLRINGCEKTDINFENNIISGYTNGGAPPDNACDVFNIDGGGANYVKPNTDALDKSQTASALYGEWYFAGEEALSGSMGDDTLSDLILYLPWINEQTCLKINEDLGITNTQITESWDLVTTNKFTGSYTDVGNNIGNNASDLSGKISGCFKGNTTGNHYYHVLVTR